jgi:lysophosphatidiate acyltransferase
LNFYKKKHGFIYVKRQSSNKEMEKLRLYYSKLDLPSWIFIFPEGTRYNPENTELITLSHKYAAEHDLPQYSNVLIPRIRGTYLALNSLKNKINAIYDVTIAYSNFDKDTNQNTKAPSLTDIMKYGGSEIHVHVNRLTIENLNRMYKSNEENEFISEQDCAKWLINSFSKKDNMLRMFYSNNFCLDDNRKGHLARLPLTKTLPALLLFTSSIVALLTNKTGRKIYFGIYIYGSLISVLYMKFDNFLKNKILK